MELEGRQELVDTGRPILVLRKSQNALKMGRFGTKNGSKMGQKRIFPNLILDHLGCTNV